MAQKVSPHLWAALQAILVTFLWSTSWVLIKIGLRDIPALPFAGLRYTLAFLCLLPFLTQGRRIEALRSLPTREWLQLMLLGVLVYSVTQGAQFLSLAYLPAVTTSLFLSFSPIIVAILAYPLLHEQLTLRQWSGAGFYLLGLFVYFYPLALPGQELIGLGVAVVGVLANALSAILGRHVNQQSQLDSTTVTVISMGAGSLTLLIVGTLVQGVPQLTLTHWGMILWLAVVNSAFAFTLWNHTQRTLRAVESSIINNTMLFQTALLAWLFLGESLTWRQGIGMVLAALGTLIVQLRRPS